MSKPKVERIGEMTNIEFKKIQHGLTTLATITGSIALFFALDAYSLHTANDLTNFGYTVMPWAIGLGVTVSILAVSAKLVAYSRR